MSKPASDNSYEVIEHANPLRGKVGPPQAPDPDLIARAEAAIHDMADDYLGWVMDDLTTLEAKVAEFVAAPDAARRAEALSAVYGVAHDIKGQGSTFEFALVTGVAGSLCRYLERTDELRKAANGITADQEIVAAHVAALRAVIRHGVKGDGGALGQQVMDGLAKAVERSAARAATTEPRA